MYSLTLLEAGAVASFWRLCTRSHSLGVFSLRAACLALSLSSKQTPPPALAHLAFSSSVDKPPSAPVVIEVTVVAGVAQATQRSPVSGVRLNYICRMPLVPG